MKAANSNFEVDLAARAYKEMVTNGFVPDFELGVVKQIEKIEQEEASRQRLAKHQKRVALQARAIKSGDIKESGDTIEPGEAQESGQSKSIESKPISKPIKDLRSLLWSSIDNPESRDLDQIEYAERLPDGNTRLLIGIADVDFFVGRSTAIDEHAYSNATSVYTGIVTYPMLPDQLSTDLSSLVPDGDRRAIVFDLTLNKLGAIVQSDIYPAWVRNHAKLDYEMIGAWLEQIEENPGTGTVQVPAKVRKISGLTEQILLQNELTEQIQKLRREHGALMLQTIEAKTITKDGQVLDLQSVERNPARELIENLMIAANIGVSHYLESQGVPSIRRIVRTPERWSRIVEVARSYGERLPAIPDALALSRFLIARRKADPLQFPDLSLAIVKLLGPGEYVVQIPGQKVEGHFALAVRDYTHATAPNRRYADLVTQRLIKSTLDSVPIGYSLPELNSVAAQCTERENAAKKVERTVRKIASAILLSSRIGDIFDGIVTGAKKDATYVRILRPPVEGRIIKGERGLDVGDKIKVRLLATNPDLAYIDFACVKNQGKAHHKHHSRD